MKAYQSFLDRVWTFLGSDWGFPVILASVIIGVLIFATRTGLSMKHDRVDNIAWCLDQGGRQAEIDDITDCFQLTEVILESEIFKTQIQECTRVPTQIYIKAPGDGVLYFCYEFQRINREN